jgi:hypothetical protein
MRIAIVVLLCFVLLAAAPLFAADLSGRDLVVPVVARVPGLFGSDWRTDLIVANLSANGLRPPVDVTLTFFRSGAVPLTATLQLSSMATATLADVVLSTFHLSNASGLLRITGPADASIAGRAYIYNSSATGETGQSIPAVPLDALTGLHTLPALSGIGGRRTNVGIANPWSTDDVAYVQLFDDTGALIAFEFRPLPPQSVTQFDVFAEMKVLPRGSATVVVLVPIPVYVYASTIRADGGAATFVIGSGISSANEDFGSPLCLAPAPLLRGNPVAPGWIGVLAEGTDTATVVASLSVKYGFSATPLLAIGMFLAQELNGAQLAGLRCEPAVRSIGQNSFGYPLASPLRHP